MNQSSKVYSNWVKAWLITGVIMVLFQVVIGGVTRLTGSGLSITKWEIVLGTIPPMNYESWMEAFELYKATPQYLKINKGMSLSEFKFIYFWEYFHRLWARLMGFVFLIPFILFYFFGLFDRKLTKRLVIIFLLAGIVASFGWIMVASGLVNRPWVNAYKLTMHLSLALILYSYLLWTVFLVVFPGYKFNVPIELRKFGLGILILLGLQIVVGGVMSGIKAGLYFPTWPLIDGGTLPKVLMDGGMWKTENFENYDNGTSFMPALIQVIHRNLAYVITFLVVVFSIRIFRSSVDFNLQRSTIVLLALLGTQVLLGIFTLVNCIGTVPVGLGVMHQAFALLLLSSMLFQYYQMKIGN